MKNDDALSPGRRQTRQERGRRRAAEREARRARAANARRARELTDTNARLNEAETLKHQLFANNPRPRYIVDRATTQFLEVNDATTNYYEFSRADLLEMTLRDIEPLSELANADLRRANLSNNEIDIGIWRHLTHSGRSVDVELSIHPIDWRDRAAWLIMALDVTEQRQAQRDLALQTKAMSASHSGIFIMSAARGSGSVVYVNEAMAGFMRCSNQTLIGCSMHELLAGVDHDSVHHMISSLRTHARVRSVISLDQDTDDPLWLEVQITVMPGHIGDPGYWIGVVQDISEQKRFEAALAYRAGHDLLTDLSNRATVARRLTTEIETADRERGEDIAVLFLDINDFKHIINQGGHEAGDFYLRTIAERLRTRIRGDDTLARVGGDEFVLLWRCPDPAEQIPPLIQRLHAAFQDPVHYNEHRLVADVSIGIACYPQHGTNAETLLRRADLTMHMAKRQGRHSVEWFSDALEQEFRERGMIEAQLRRALDTEAFTLHYQPQIDLSDQSIFGVEALLRWPGADPAYAAPDIFIRVAEEIGLIGDIGRWVLDRACRDLADLRRRADLDLTMAINVSVEQLREPTFANVVADTLAAHGLGAAALEIEVTESLCMTQYAGALDTLTELHALGVKIAIDDFGTGFSSLSYLSRLPIHRLKIDRSFVRAIHETERSVDLVRMLTELADRLELQTVAEGVETEAELQALKACGCRLAQGFLFSRPLALADLKEKLATQTAMAQ